VWAPPKPLDPIHPTPEPPANHAPERLDPVPPGSCTLGVDKNHVYPDPNTTTTKWLLQQPSPVFLIPQFHHKHMLATMHHQPHPSPSFMTVLLGMAKNNYQPPNNSNWPLYVQQDVSHLYPIS